MARVEKQVGIVQSTLKLVSRKTRTINGKLHGVETLELHAVNATALVNDDEPVEDSNAEIDPAVHQRPGSDLIDDKKCVDGILPSLLLVGHRHHFDSIHFQFLPELW